MPLPQGLEVVVRTMHILSAILWLGLIYFMALVRPRVMGGLPEDTRRQVMPHLARWVTPWMLWSAVLTIGLGAVLYWSLGDRIGFENIGMGLNIGVMLALLMFVLGASFVLPFSFKVAKILEGGKPPGPAEIRRATLIGQVNAVLSLLVVFFMVTSQRLFVS